MSHVLFLFHQEIQLKTFFHGKYGFEILNVLVGKSHLTLKIDKNTNKFIGSFYSHVENIKKQNGSEAFLLFNLSSAEITLPTEKEAEKLVAYKGDWTNHFGEDYYLQKLKENMDEPADNWQSQIDGVPFETDDYSDVTSYETIKSHIHELTKDLKQEVGNGQSNT